MKIHILAGDSLADNFKDANIEGEIVVCRECLVEGAVKAENIDEFWKVRAGFIKSAYGEEQEKYYKTVVSEFEKLNDLSSVTEINLWFEYELFCQTNMWFCLYLLQNTSAKIYRIAPVLKTEENIWEGFSNLNAEDLRKCFAARIGFTADQVSLGANLWKSFQNADYEALEQVSDKKSACFPYLKEVCRAEIEKDFYPREILREIKAQGLTDFTKVFSEFSNRAGVYGFGDAQVKRIWQKN